MASRSKGKGKSQDRSTQWSDYQWDNRGFWFSSRLNASGEEEYEYRYPEPPKTTEQQQATPRYTGPDIISSNSERQRNSSSSGGLPLPSHDTAAAAGRPIYMTTPEYNPAQKAKYAATDTSGIPSSYYYAAGLATGMAANISSSTGYSPYPAQPSGSKAGSSGGINYPPPLYTIPSSESSNSAQRPTSDYFQNSGVNYTTSPSSTDRITESLGAVTLNSRSEAQDQGTFALF